MKYVNYIRVIIVNIFVVTVSFCWLYIPDLAVFKEVIYGNW